MVQRKNLNIADWKDDSRIGGGYAVVVREHPAQWVKSRIELRELIRLRQAGLTVAQLTERFGVSRTTVKNRLRAIRAARE